MKDRERETECAIRYRVDLENAQRRGAGFEQVIASQRTTLQNMAADLGRLSGYQERVREEDRNRYGDLPGASA